MTETVSHATPSSSSNIEAQIRQKRAGNRQKVHHGGTLCSGCYDEPPLPGQRYGRNCKNKYQADRQRAERAELARLRALEQQQG